ncbi:hypothetical protein [Ensifer sp. 4252]|uniref:hypothetical protein n=1 Tax=Ensifer sp. 4252 TaxID=3373915 RepID=UPI003D207EF1
MKFEKALTKLPDGRVAGLLQGCRWAGIIRHSADGKRAWLYGKELGGTDVVSFTL